MPKPLPEFKFLMPFSMLAFGLLLMTMSVTLEADSSLPDIGDPGGVILTEAQEQRLGSVIQAQVRGSLNVTTDPELSSYIHSLGTRLLSSGVNTSTRFRFMIVMDPAINAFAAPGGVVVINSGLITTADSESEVAGVLAHEIAHVTQRHLVRTVANAQRINLATGVAVLASILASVYNPDAGTAALSSTLAASSQAQLSFSRGNEQEADRVGMRYLAASGYDPNGMPEFLEHLHQYAQLNSGQLPEFLSTHPVTAGRIADTRNRADQYKGKFIRNSIHFEFAKARVIALTATPADLISRYEKSLKENQEYDVMQHYSYAIALIRAGSPARAYQELTSIKDSGADNLSVSLAMIQALMADNKPQEALAIAKRLDEIYPDHESIVYYLAESLIDTGNPKAALNKLDRLSRLRSNNPAIHKLKARAAAEAGQPWVSHESLAEYYFAHAQLGTALEHINIALQQPGIDRAYKSRLQSERKLLLRLEAGEDYEELDEEEEEKS